MSSLLSDVLVSFAAYPDVVQYGELMSKSRLNHRTMVKHRQMIRALIAVQPSLKFSQTYMLNALMKTAKACEDKWVRPLEASSELPDWSTRMGKRLRTMLSHFNRARSRHPDTAWVRRVLADDGPPVSSDEEAADPGSGKNKRMNEREQAESVDDEDGEEEEEEEEEEDAELEKDQFVFGYDHEVGKAFKATLNGVKVAWASPVSGVGAAPPTACFDGKSVPLAGVTSAELVPAAASGHADASSWKGKKGDYELKVVRPFCLFAFTC